jgi:hypothetical protein
MRARRRLPRDARRISMAGARYRACPEISALVPIPGEPAGMAMLASIRASARESAPIAGAQRFPLSPGLHEDPQRRGERSSPPDIARNFCPSARYRRWAP